MSHTITLPKLPAKSTLKKYGLTMSEWLEYYQYQMGACAVCHTPFKEGQRINVDHAHVKGWKKMAPAQRRLYVRGLLCYTCNKFSAMRGMTPLKAWNLWMYLRSFEVRITSRNVNTSKQVVESGDVGHPDQDEDKKHHSRQ